MRTPSSFVRSCALAAGLATLCGFVPLASGQDTLVPRGALWSYCEVSNAPGGDWAGAGYDDAAWPSGAAPLGYGDGDEATVIGFGTNAAAKFVTAYFRRSFAVTNAARFCEYSLRLQRDDGAAIYLNGVEVARDNLPAGPIQGDTLARTAVGAPAENDFIALTIPAGSVTEGINVIAVEVHQSAPNSSDLSFDLELTGVRPPIHLAVLAPTAGALDAGPEVALSVEARASDSSEVQAAFFGRPAGPAAGPDFTIIALPDTQNYVSGINGGTPEHFTAQTDWILANRQARNIVFVTQLGDCVQNGDNGDNDTEWRHATNAMYRLENPMATLVAEGLPYGVAVGNHDQSGTGNADGTTVFYNQYFGESHFAGREYYGGHQGENNDNHFELFSASGLDFIIVHLEYDSTPDAAVLDWANELLRAHASRRAIVVSHWIINAGFQASFSGQGQAIYDALKGNPNLFLMLCGHVSPEEGQRVDVYQGNTVHTLMSDYQSRPNGGDGWLRILTFSPSNNVIRVQTYSPTLDRFETDADSQFTLDYNMRLGEPFVSLGQAVAANAEGAVSVFWTNLVPQTAYEWYVVVGDGARTQRSPIWSFSTGAGQPADAGGGQAGGEGHSLDSTTGNPGADPDASLRIMFLRAYSDRMELGWNSVPGRTYRVCSKASLGQARWADCSPDIEAGDVLTQWSETRDPAAAIRFYAVREVR